MLLLGLFWLICAFSVFVGSILTFIPSTVKAVSYQLMYGKIRSLSGLSTKSSILMVPKKWFTHFYVVGIIFTSTALYVVINTFLFTGQWPELLQFIFSIVGHAEKDEVMEPLPVILALLMEEIQVIRRCYECVYINSYSDSAMSLPIYGTGLIFYMLIGLTVLTYSPEGLVNTEMLHLNWHHVIAVLLFLWASYKQYRVNKIIAKLRQDKIGNVVDRGHHVPHGDLFEYVSCPHFFLEIMIYTSVNILFLWQHWTCFCLWVFVTTNQILMGYYGHTWYKQNFPKYPLHRKAIIPYIF